VERDLGVFRDKKLEHRTNDMYFLDDALVITLNGPSTATEFAEGAADPLVELTEFVRQCASLWRELCGWRFGHQNPKATAAARLAKVQKPGEFTGCMRGVLNAARIAVRDARRKSRTAELHEGAGTADSAHWSEAMTKFRATTDSNIPGVTQTREQPGGQFINPPGVHLTKRRAAGAQPLASPQYYHVAVVGANSQLLAGPLRQCVTLTGRHRCEDAQLVVVPDLKLLHDEDALAGDVDLAVSFLYLVALGLDITTQANLVAPGVQNTPRRLTPEHCVRHIPAITQEVTFCLGPALDRDVRSALRRLKRREGSNFSVEERPSAGADSDDVFIGTVRDVVAWASEARRVANERGPKALDADGRRMPA
jgi:hypothetical protein